MEYRGKKNDQGDEWYAGGERVGDRGEGGPIAELGATSRRQTGHDARPANRTFLIANTGSLGEFPVHPRASIHPGPPRPFIAENLGFPFVVFPADWRDHLQIGGG